MQLVSDADKLLGTKTSKLAEIAPKIILYAQRKRRNTLEVKSLLAGLNESTTNEDDLNGNFTKWLSPKNPNVHKCFSRSAIDCFTIIATSDATWEKEAEQNHRCSIVLSLL